MRAPARFETPSGQWTLLMIVALLLAASVVTVLIVRQDAEPPSRTYQVSLSDFAIEAPTTMKARRANIRVVNNWVETPHTHGPGEEAPHAHDANQGVHQLQIVRLDDGHSADDLRSVNAWPSDDLPAWAVTVGGVAYLAPGNAATAHLKLAKGDYALLCRLPDANGASHASKGMVTGFTAR